MDPASAIDFARSSILILLEIIAPSMLTALVVGLGIGLFHSRLIVEAHRGVLEVNSSVGAGTEFRVLLPTGS